MNSHKLLMNATDEAFSAGVVSQVEYTDFVCTLGKMPEETKDGVIGVVRHAAYFCDSVSQLLTAESRATLAAFDWQSLLTMLTPLFALIPGFGPFLPIIGKLIPFILSLIKGGGGTNGGGGSGSGGEPPDPITD